MKDALVALRSAQGLVDDFTALDWASHSGLYRIKYEDGDLAPLPSRGACFNAT